MACCLVVFVETPLGKQLAKLLLPPLAFEFSDGLTMCGAIGRANAELRRHPKRPVALLLNAGMNSEFMVDESRLSPTCPRTGFMAFSTSADKGQAERAAALAEALASRSNAE